VDEFDADMVADFKTLEPVLQPPLGRRLKDPPPCAFGRGPGDNGVEGLPQTAGQEQRRRRIADLTLNFGGGIFLLGAMPGEFCFR